jgi:hypothetical protein
MDDYETAKRTAKEFYRTIGCVWCPALGDYIAFTDIGFRHLIWRKQWPRPRKEQIQRFVLLPCAPNIVENALVCGEYRASKQKRTVKWHGGEIGSTPPVQFWALAGGSHATPIKVIIRQIGNGKKQFLSIFKETKTDS